MPKINPRIKSIDDLLGLDAAEESPIEPTPSVSLPTKNTIITLPPQAIRAFRGHPFRLYEGDRLNDLVESISEHGVLNPAIIRKIERDEDGFEYPNCEPILADVNFQIHRGEIVGIVGHNGVGKSTLAELICGLQKECAGEVFLKGEKAKPKQRIKSTYLVMQDSDYQLFTESVENEIYLGVKEDAELKKRGQNILEQMDLTDHLEKHPASLSGGQKQRLCIAVAYLKDADIICFDEPTSGLDYASMQRVKDLFEKMSADGKTILVISHDYEFILATCTSIMSVQDNRVCDVFSLYEKNRKKLIKSMQVLDAEGGEI